MSADEVKVKDGSRSGRRIAAFGVGLLLLSVAVGTWAMGAFTSDPDIPEDAFANSAGTFFSTHGAPPSALRWMESQNLIFNRPLPADTPKVENSELIAGHIDEIIRGERLYDYGSGIEEDNNAPHILLVDSDSEDFTEIRFRPEACGSSTWWNWTADDFEPYINGSYAEAGKSGVPVPTDFEMSADDDDLHVVIYDWRRDTLIELWRAMTPNLTGRSGIEVCWGGITKNFASAGTGTFPFPVGVSASGTSSVGLAITLEDVRRGEIKHAIGVSSEIAIDDQDQLSFSYPANRNDGFCSDHRAGTDARVAEVTEAMGGAANCLFEGQYLRLPADFDLDSVTHPYARMIAEAARDYGLVLQDSAACFCFQAESSQTVTQNGFATESLWEGFYNGTPEWDILWQIDWSQLEVLPRDWNKPSEFQIPCAAPPSSASETNPLAGDPRCQASSPPYSSG